MENVSREWLVYQLRGEADRQDRRVALRVAAGKPASSIANRALVLRKSADLHESDGREPS